MLIPSTSVEVPTARRIYGRSEHSSSTDEFVPFTRQRFAAARKDGAPTVYIPAKNEADDLPRTLLSIAAAEGISPVVIDNDSEDETAQVARRMGATVIDVPYGRKMAATKAAFEHAEEVGERDLLFIDADTVVSPRWAQAMTRRLGKADRGAGSAVFGSGAFWYGENLTADVFMSVAKLGRGTLASLRPRGVAPRGHNYAVRTDGAGEINAAISLLPNDMFAGDDYWICRTLQDSGAAVTYTMSPDTLVLTKNDRVGNIHDIARRMQPGYSNRRHEEYEKQYG